MPTDYNQIAEQYKKAKLQPWRMHIEHYTLFNLLGDLHGKSLLDLACGEGFFSRFIKLAGAGRVVGVDISQGMIDLAQAEEKQRPRGIEYLVHDAKTLRLTEKFDVVAAAYLLNYAQTAEELLEMCQVCARHLRPGCRFVTVNNNPAQPVEFFEATAKYGIVKGSDGELLEGSPVTYTFMLDQGSLTITNYHLSVATHERALREAGFHDIRWHPPQVSPEGNKVYGKAYWAAFLDHPPVIFLECSL
jgi:ubiquinone/menaquinone biosynthesis C-methylase UbiE